MKHPLVAIAAAAIAALTLVPAAQAGHRRHHGHHHHGGHVVYDTGGEFKGKGPVAHLRYGPKPQGYWRPGPETGYGFRFSSYRGDPFGKNDYYDRHGCYYLRGANYCLPQYWYRLGN